MPEHTPGPTPARAVYGFAFYLLFCTLIVFYTLWSLLPLDNWGLTYLPDRYFALLLPVVTTTGLGFFIFFIYPAVGMSLTPAVDELTSITQSKKKINGWDELICETQCQKRNKTSLHCETCKTSHEPTKVKQIPPLKFLDLSEVNKSICGSKMA